MPTCLIDGVCYDSDDMIHIVQGYVHKKYKNRLERCNECCGLYLPDEHLDGRCPICENMIYERDINSYSTKPVAIFKTDKKSSYNEQGCRYYGLEMEFNNTSPYEVHRLGEQLYNDKYLYNKRDGSISNGVEVVTSPLDKKSLKYVIGELSKNVFEYINTRMYKDNAGIHIHVNKRTIDVLDRYKLCILLNTECYNDEKYIMYYLSGRTTKSTDRKSVFSFCDIGQTTSLRSQLRSHGVALNTANKHTYEFRIFKTTTDVNTIMSYVELVDKMIEYCHCHGINDINISSFIGWLKVNTKNEIIKHKIKTFERKCKFHARKTIVSQPELYGMLKGIRWTEYDKLMGYIERVNGNKSLLKCINSFKRNSDMWTLDIYRQDENSELYDRIENTLRVCLANELYKEINRVKKEKNKCA